MVVRAAPSGGLGLFGILIILMLLYISGAGGWLLQRMQGLEGNCYSLVSSMHTSLGGPICAGIGKGVLTLSQMAEVTNQHLQETKNWFQANIYSLRTSDIGSLGTSLEYASLQRNIGSFGSSADRLRQMISQGPGHFTGVTTAQQFQQAIDSFTIGQQYRIQSGNAAQALPWLQQGARQPEGFGILSQLSLGDLYRTGGPGVAPDPIQARAYYDLAARSLNQLSSSTSPQSRQLLGALPAPPQVIREHIDQAIVQMNRR